MPAPSAPQPWPVFICYRRVDGSPAARRLYEVLDKVQEAGPQGQLIRLDVYFDQAVPGVADWKEAMHRPYLEKARALIVICTPGAMLNEGADDWVHREIDWWLAHRRVAPILIDPLMEGPRYVPKQIAKRWPDIQRIVLLEKEWTGVAGAALTQKAEALRRHVVGAMLPSGAAIYAQELAAERQRAQRLKRALAVSQRSQRIAEASLLDTRAASTFNESRLIDARCALEMGRRRDLTQRMSEGPQGIREANLRHELEQLDADVAALKRRSKDALENGRALLEQADVMWAAIEARRARVERARPEPPHVLSVELVNAGHGESVLLHYGTPDDIKVIMLNAGPGGTFHEHVGKRLRELSVDRYDSRPVPIELLIVGDRDEDKTGGLLRLLEGIADPQSPHGPLAEIRGIWANLFRVQGEREDLRSRIRRLIDELKIPFNQPFDRSIVRPERGRACVPFAGGLEIVVLGPAQSRVKALHAHSTADARRRKNVVEPLEPERFVNVPLVMDPAPLKVIEEPWEVSNRCISSKNARANAVGAYLDNSVANLASTILLFRFRGLTFLFTGDARGDLILEGLSCSGLLDQGRAAVNLMTVPHLGSSRNSTVDFFRRVRASGYLFSGNGRHGNPEVGTVAALITARGCDAYRMYFVNRDGIADRRDETLGSKLDAFFRAEQPFHPNYRRIFRSAEGGSVIIDMLTPMPR